MAVHDNLPCFKQGSLDHASVFTSGKYRERILYGNSVVYLLGSIDYFITHLYITDWLRPITICEVIDNVLTDCNPNPMLKQQIE